MDWVSNRMQGTRKRGQIEGEGLWGSASCIVNNAVVDCHEETTGLLIDRNLEALLLSHVAGKKVHVQVTRKRRRIERIQTWLTAVLDNS